jgi:hypothetical protein
MPDLKNSQRRLYKVTYEPIQIDPQHSKPEDISAHDSTSRALDKINYIHALNIYPSEISTVREQLKSPDFTRESSNLKENLVNVIDVVEELVNDPSKATTSIRHARKFSKLDPSSLIMFGNLLAERRQQLVNEVERSITKIRKNYTAILEGDGKRTVATSVPVETKGTSTADSDFGSNLHPARRGLRADSTREQEQSVKVKLVTPRRSTLTDAIDWAVINDPSNTSKLKAIAQYISPIKHIYSNLTTNENIENLIENIQPWANYTWRIVTGFEERMQVEPVGRLHLERIETTPAGVERGELINSVPLSPAESITISHKEWSTKTDEFQTIIQDSFEGYSEEGVSEKNDISMASDSQSQHSTSLNIGASYSGFGATVSTSFGYAANDSRTQKESRNQSVALTRKASARTRKEHKYSVKISSVSGEEDASSRVIKNPSDTDPMRIDYYQLIRKWKCELFRYDLRMTYDIVIPNPGLALAKKLEELYNLDKEIETEFKFDVSISEIDPYNPSSWLALAEIYNAGNINPLPSPIERERMIPHDSGFVGAGDDLDESVFKTISFHVPDERMIRNARYIVESIINRDSGKAALDIYVDENARVRHTAIDNFRGGAIPRINGKSGNFEITYRTQSMYHVSIFLFFY